MSSGNHVALHADDHVAILGLQRAYADVVSRQAFAELADLFVPDIRLLMEMPGHTKEIVGPQAFGEYVARRIAHLEFFQFVIDNAVVGAIGDPDHATGRMWFHELHQDAEHHRLVRLHGLYRDEFVRVDDRWWFAERRFAPLAMTSADAGRDFDVFPNPSSATGRPPR
jgi:hypothetical protein